MSSSTEQWFVRTSFGALLGPMPEDALTEMARTGALLRTDKLREGLEGIWHPAGDVPGLFDGVAAPLSQPGARVGDLLPRAMQDGSFVMAKASEIPRSPDDVPARDANESSTQNDAPVSLDSSDPLQEAFWRMTEPVSTTEATTANASRSRQSVESEMAAQDETEFEVDVSLIPADRAVVSEQTEPPPAIEELDFGRSDFKSVVKPLAEPIESPPPITPTISRRPVTSRSRSARWLDWSRSWPIWAVVAGLLIVFSAWWFWPRQRPDIYTRYVAIHDELKKRRDTPQDETGLKDFVSRANRELDELLPGIEELASQNHEQRLLLFLGRDCLREILKQPQTENVRHERLFAAFSSQLQEIYDPSRRTAPNADSGVATSEGSSRTGLRTPHPDSPRGRSSGLANTTDPTKRPGVNGK